MTNFDNDTVTQRVETISKHTRILFRLETDTGVYTNLKSGFSSTDTHPSLYERAPSDERNVNP